jgi:5-methylcytosine-specific restriction endonuclease McrA
VRQVAACGARARRGACGGRHPGIRSSTPVVGSPRGHPRRKMIEKIAALRFNPMYAQVVHWFMGRPPADMCSNGHPIAENRMRSGQCRECRRQQKRRKLHLRALLGLPCRHGHPADQQLPSGICRACRVDWRERTKHRREHDILGHTIARSHRQLCKKARGQPRASVKELRALYDKQSGRCALTGLPFGNERPHLDHIVPVFSGGAHTIDNLQWTCGAANAAKNSDSVADFHKWVLDAAQSIQDSNLATRS